MSVIGWVAIYIIGLLVTAAIQSKCRQSPTPELTFAQKEELEMGRAFTILFWPIFLPIFLIMWISSR